MMAPADERCDRRIIALSHRLNTAISSVGHPATETEPPRCSDRRGAKRDTLDTPCDVQPFAYDHRIPPATASAEGAQLNGRPSRSIAEKIRESAGECKPG